MIADGRVKKWLHKQPKKRFSYVQRLHRNLQ